MSALVRPYLYYDTAVSICSTCYRRVDAKIVFEQDNVYMLKRCPEHGFERVLIADDVDYYKRTREVFVKPPEMPARYNTPVKYGCPYDCGLCPDHEQHSCLSLLEITDTCNLQCPICYAESGPHRVGADGNAAHRPLEQVERMLDCIVQNELTPDIVQISGGEPTIHPQFFEILDACKARPIQHLMVNTNGLRIAQDEEFTARLATYMPRFELYLQFDSLEREPLMQLRGADLRRTREQALERLNRHNISTTLVVTVSQGHNDEQLGALVDFALKQPCVRGITFQPIQQAGRTLGYEKARHRLTLTEVRRRILDQTRALRPGVLAPEDLIPVPCHPDSLAMAYMLKLPAEDGSTLVQPLTHLIPPEVLIEGGRNTIIYEQDPAIREHLFKLFSTNHSPAGQANSLRELLCCMPKILAPQNLTYQNLFRILIVQFIDAQSFDLRSIKKTCVHIAHPDGQRMIPFDTYNMFYRDHLEQTRLAPLRERTLATI